MYPKSRSSHRAQLYSIHHVLPGDGEVVFDGLNDILEVIELGTQAFLPVLEIEARIEWPHIVWQCTSRR